MLHHLTQRQKIIIMAAVMSGLFLAALDQTIVGTALPKILQDFNALQELSWVVTAYLLTATITTPIAGKLSDLYGRRRLLLSGIIIFILASLFCGAAQNIEQLIAARALQGIGGGILFANAFSVIGDLFSARERGKWQGIIGAVFGLSSLVGPLLGGYLTDAHTLLGLTTNWRWTFLINIPIGLMAYGLITKYLPTMNTKKEISIDYLGAGLLSAALAALVLACSLGGTAGWAWHSWQIIGMFVASAVFAASFIWVELRAREPIIPMHLYSKSVYSLIALLMLLFGMAFFGAIIYIPTFAQQVLHYSATNSGIIILPMVIGLTASSIVVGQIVNKTGKYKGFMVAGLAIATVGIWTLAGLDPNSTYWDLTWRMALVGIGMGMGIPIFTVAAQNAVDHTDMGVASSGVQLFRSIGSTVGLAILGSFMNNVLTQKLANIQEDPFVKLANQSGQGAQFSNFDINALQGFLAAKDQVAAKIAELPPALQQTASEALANFVKTLEFALANSITQIFVISAFVMAAAVVVSVFIKEIPLKHYDDSPPV